MDISRSGSKGLIREINESLVLRHIRSEPGLSRTEIARRSGLSLPTVSGITAQMLASGLLEERDGGRVARGRPPTLLSLRAASGRVVGIKLTETHVVAVLTDLQARVVARAEVETMSTAVSAVVDAIAQAVDSLRPSAAGAPIHGIGLGMAGVIGGGGLVHHATYANWGEIDLAAAIEQATSLPALVDNDVNCLVAHEQWFGAGRGVANFAVISVGRGIGLGLVMGNQLQRGARGGAGELGHVKVSATGPACVCGGQGCLEAQAALPAIAARLSAQLGRPVGPAAALDLLDAGAGAAVDAFTTAGLMIGRATGNVINIINPGLVVLTGEALRTTGPLPAAFEEGLAQTSFEPLRRNLTVVVEPLDEDAWAQGSASLLLGDLFTPRLRSGDEGRPSLAAG